MRKHLRKYVGCGLCSGVSCLDGSRLLYYIYIYTILVDAAQVATILRMPGFAENGRNKVNRDTQERSGFVGGA